MSRLREPGVDVNPYTAWRALLTVSYEVDLFGRVSDTVNATRSDYESNVATFRSVTLALQADVAQTYFALRATDDELRILWETVKWREESVRLLQKRFDLGDISELDLARAKTEASNARTEAIGPLKGIGETANAAEAPFIANTSPSFCRSLAITNVNTWTSSWNQSGNRGRMGRSISRAVRVSLVVGRPSRLRNPPGNFPAAATRSR